MFRPVVAIIRFYHSTHLRLFYTIRVVVCLMRRFHHQYTIQVFSCISALNWKIEGTIVIDFMSNLFQN